MTCAVDEVVNETEVAKPIFGKRSVYAGRRAACRAEPRKNLSVHPHDPQDRLRSPLAGLRDVR